MNPHLGTPSGTMGIGINSGLTKGVVVPEPDLVRGPTDPSLENPTWGLTRRDPLARSVFHFPIENEQCEASA